jgi:hypothetical protein
MTTRKYFGSLIYPFFIQKYNANASQKYTVAWDEGYPPKTCSLKNQKLKLELLSVHMDIFESHAAE